MKLHKPRKLKVYYGFHSGYKQYPIIHFGGDYLSNAGFKIGDEVEMTLADGLLVIKKIRKENKALE